MAFDFPSSPVEGQTFNVLPQRSYIYRGGLWQKNDMVTALPKNYVVNPAFQISQQNGATAQTAHGTYPADQWLHIRSGVTATNTIAQVASVTANGSVNRLRIVMTLAQATLAAGDYFGVLQRIEGQRITDLKFGTASASPIVVRFGFKGPIGTYAFTVRTGGATYWSYSAAFAITTANVDTTITIPIPGAPVGGTWANDNTPGMELWWVIASGTTQASLAPDYWRASSAIAHNTITNNITALSTFELYDVGLYKDPYATEYPPAWEPPVYTNELRRCQRYWYRSFGARGIHANTATANWMSSKHPVLMRIQPTLAIVGAVKVYDGATTPTVSALTNMSNTYQLEWNSTVAGVLGGRPAMQYYTNDNEYIAVSARM